ncbi:uncharacterized protein [Typha latifolia]|uniref:uncharacterized protein n=1 Tax=Typha latifolia TaxID=4733 RepID=UPI003C2D2C53
MAGRSRPQPPFRFWMPYWSNPAPIPSRPAALARRQPLPRAPTVDPPPSRRRRTSSSGLPAPPALSAYSLREENASQRSSSSPMQSLAQSRPVNKRSETPSPSRSTVRAAAPTTQASRHLEQVKTATSPTPQSASQPPQIGVPPQTQLESNRVKEEDHMDITQENSKANRDSEPDGNHSQLQEIEEEPEGVNSQMNPVKAVDSDIIPEEQPDKEEVVENEEPQAQKTQNDTIKPEHSGPASHIKISSKGSEVNLGLNISRPENCEKIDDTSSERPIRQNDSNGRGTKISISDIPRGSLFDGHRAAYHKEIEDGFSKLASGVAEEPRRCGPAMNMITLAGENTGASMIIGDPRNNEMLNSGSRKGPGMGASVNSNVQSINNSTLHDSSCSARNPGVHVEIKSKQAEPEIRMARTRIEPLKVKDKARDANSHSDKRLPHEPRVRRRCLRALFMESESDPENPQKPRRHGCRFSCDEKRAKANQGGVSTSNPNHF